MFFRVVLLTAFVSGLALAQSTYGEIRGTVTDPSGAVLPQANIAARSITTNEKRTATSDAAGNYAVPNLDAGTYEVEVESQGFRKSLIQNIAVRRDRAKIQKGLQKIGFVNPLQVVVVRSAIRP